MATRKTRTKTAAPNLPVPQDDAQARSAILEIGRERREVDRLKAAMNDEIAAIKARYGAQAEPHRERETALTEGLAIFAEANRARLTDGEKRKHALFSTGRIGWRTKVATVRANPKAAGVADEAGLIAKLRDLGLARFVRVKEELNREAMREEKAVASAVAGITVGSEGEDFWVEPDDDALQEAVA
jgi:phage host-nuclease inhibitor protein Gam